MQVGKLRLEIGQVFHLVELAAPFPEAVQGWGIVRVVKDETPLAVTVVAADKEGSWVKARGPENKVFRSISCGRFWSTSEESTERYVNVDWLAICSHHLPTFVSADHTRALRLVSEPQPLAATAVQ